MVVASLRERRLVGESYRRLTGADAPQAVSVLNDEQRLELAKITAVQQYRAQLAPLPALAPPPPEYATMSPQYQAHDHLARLRAAKEAQDAAIAALPPDEADVVEAEIVS